MTPTIIPVLTVPRHDCGLHTIYSTTMQAWIEARAIVREMRWTVVSGLEKKTDARVVVYSCTTLRYIFEAIHYFTKRESVIGGN